jgi:dTDP-4-amino-4,6-dideoxygalactose transaminase
MDEILDLAKKHDLVVIEDAAQGVNAFYKGRALGSMGHLGAFSFHETKNFMCGEGGALCINDRQYLDRAHVLRDKGTNRQQLLRGAVHKYEWMEIGSSFIPSELTAAFLFGQLEEMDVISSRRRQAYDFYRSQLAALEEEGLLRLPVVPQHCKSNHHLFYILLPGKDRRESLKKHLARCGIQAISHFEPLHSSPMGRQFASATRLLSVTEAVADQLLRLPLFFEITESQQEKVVAEIRRHLKQRSKRLIALGKPRRDALGGSPA